MGFNSAFKGLIDNYVRKRQQNAQYYYI